MRGSFEREEKLAAVGVRAGIGHGEEAGLAVRNAEVLVRESRAWKKGGRRKRGRERGRERGRVREEELKAMGVKAGVGHWKAATFTVGGREFLVCWRE